MCITKEEFFYYFPYVLQPTLLPYTTSRILFIFTVNPLRISAFFTVVDLEQPLRRRGQEKMRSRGLLLKSNTLSLMPWHTLNYCSHSTMATDDLRCFSGGTKEAVNHWQALFALANDGCLLEIDKLLIIHNRFSAHFFLSGQISPRSYLLRASSRLAIKFPTLPFFGSLERRRRIDAGQALIKEDCCEKRIIVFLERNSPDYCSNCISKPDRGSATKWHLSFSP